MQKETRHNVLLVLSLLVTLALIVPGTVAGAAGPGGWGRVGGASDKLNGSVYALYPAAGVLYAGGTFYDAGGVADADYLAAWNGQNWSAVGSPLTGAVNAIVTHEGKIYAGGVFTNAGGDVNADYLAVWDGVSWASPCNAASGPAIDGNVEALEVIGQTLYVGGSFQNGGNLQAADYLLACDLATGTPSALVPGDGDISGGILTMDSDSMGNLYVGGGFDNLGSDPLADNVAYLDPTGEWQHMGDVGVNNNDGSNDFVRALTVAANDDVYVSSDGVNIAGMPKADHVARWDGTTWHVTGEYNGGDDGFFSTTTYIESMTTFGEYLFATGSFQDASTLPKADNIAYFGESYDYWRSAGSDGAGNGPWIGNGLALAVFKGAIYAGGTFTSAGGDSQARGITTYPLHRFDAAINLLRDPAVGKGVINATGNHQTVTVRVHRGQKVEFRMVFEEEGLLHEFWTIKNHGSARGFEVKWFKDGFNITHSATAGYHTRDSVVLHMVVSVSRRSAASASYLIDVVNTGGTGGKTDAVRVVVKALDREKASRHHHLTSAT